MKDELPAIRPENDFGRYLDDGALFITAVHQKDTLVLGGIAVRIQATLKGVLHEKYGTSSWKVFDVDDVTQELFLRAIKNIDKYDPAKSKPITWCLRIGLNVLKDLLRWERSRIKTERLQAESLVDTNALAGPIENDEKLSHALSQVGNLGEEFQQWCRNEGSRIGKVFEDLHQNWKAVLFVESNSRQGNKAKEKAKLVSDLTGVEMEASTFRSTKSKANKRIQDSLSQGDQS